MGEDISELIAESAKLFGFFGPKILVAVVCGGIIGLERELKSKSAGIKTNMLICIGSTIYTALSVLMSQSIAEEGFFGDPARVAAQIVTGIGFLGGGAIIQSRGNVTGLTTAATIWVMAGVGICVGLGYLLISVMISISVVMVLTGVRFFESRFIHPVARFAYEIRLDGQEPQVRTRIEEEMKDCNLSILDSQFFEKKELVHLTVHYLGTTEDNRDFQMALWRISGVKEVRPSRQN